jgi:hypothetical protein
VIIAPEFEEAVLFDFEFNGGTRNPRSDGNRPSVVCLVAWELRSGRRFRLWRDQLGKEPPYRTDNRTVFFAFYASAELTCHLSLGWKLPINIIDLFAEFRCLTNHSGDHQPPAGLLAALDHFKLDSIEARTKEHWRDIVLRGGPWSDDERRGILDYCESDVAALDKLIPIMPVSNFRQALLRGSYMRADAWMRHRGIPIDPIYADLAAHWEALRGELIADLNMRFPFFEGVSLRQKLLENWLVQHHVRYWPRRAGWVLGGHSISSSARS